MGKVEVKNINLDIDPELDEHSTNMQRFELNLFTDDGDSIDGPEEGDEEYKNAEPSPVNVVPALILVEDQ